MPIVSIIIHQFPTFISLMICYKIIAVLNSTSAIYTILPSKPSISPILNSIDYFLTVTFTKITDVKFFLHNIDKNILKNIVIYFLAVNNIDIRHLL